MTASKQGGGRRGAVLAAATTAVLALVGAALIGVGIGDSQGPGPEAGSASETRESSTQSGANTPVAPVPGGRNPDLGPVMPGSRPVALSIPSIGVRSGTIVGLGLAKDGSIEVPRDPAAPGWFTPGPSPGQFGPAIIAGHVDGKDGPAVFYRLGELRRGAQVQVARANGSTATFVVDRVKQYDKDRFPTRAVYGNTTDRAELRLITCSGEFDAEDGYQSNTVAFAHLVD